MFSGGVDSSLIALICKQAGADFICYTIGYGETARDVEWAKKVEQLGAGEVFLSGPAEIVFKGEWPIEVKMK